VQHQRPSAHAASSYAPIVLEGGRQFSAKEIADFAEAYVRDGFVHVPGLVTPDETEAAVAALWRQMEVEKGLRPGQPETWAEGGRGGGGAVTDPAVLACWSPGHLTMMEALTREMEAAAAVACLPALPSPDVLVRPLETMMINKFPDSTSEEWLWPGPHIDHAGDNWQVRLNRSG
jgi:hypothetical protein